MTARTGFIAPILIVLVAVGVLGADTWVEPPRSAPVPEVIEEASAPIGGVRVCGVGQSGPGGELRLLASRPRDGRDAPSTVEVQHLEEGVGAREALPQVFPGGATDVTVEPGDAPLTGTLARWSGAPATVWREWRIEGDRDLPDATVAGPCAAPSAPRWIIPGLSTEGGDEARLRLSNPFLSAATVAVGFLTPAGAAEPLILRNLSVPAGSVREVVVNETLPEEADLTAVVEVASGRVSVEGVQVARAAIGGIDGASLLQAAPAAAEEWTIPWVSDGARSSSWLWIANPGERTAAVELMLHTPAGGELPEGLAEVSVPPGEMRRVDLSGTFPQDVRTAAVTARSNGAPVVVSGATRLTSADPEDPAPSGIAVQLGATSADSSWVVSGVGTPDRSEELHIVNPTGADATVDVEVFNGVVALAPPQLRALEIPAGSTRVVELDTVLDGRSPWSAFVTATEGEVVVGLVGRTLAEGASRHLVAVVGTPSAAWSARGAELAAVERPGMVRSLGTGEVAGTPVPETDRAPGEGVPPPDVDSTPDAPEAGT